MLDFHLRFQPPEVYRELFPGLVFIESFNGPPRDECLNASVFISLHDARQKIEASRIDYNAHRPHGLLGDLTPREFAEQAAKTGLQEERNFQLSAV